LTWRAGRLSIRTDVRCFRVSDGIVGAQPALVIPMPPKAAAHWTSAMCRELDAVRQSILAYAGRFDPRSLTPTQAAAMVRACAQIEASVASIKMLAAARAAEGSTWQDEGYRSPADQLAHHAGMSPSAAKRALDTGRRMTNQPDVAKAALAGELSAEQATAVSDGAAANPAKTTELIDTAKRSSVPELNEEVARTKAAVTDQEARRKAIHAKRSLRRWTDRDGALHAHLYGHPQDGASLWRMLDPIRRRLNLRRRPTRPDQPVDPLDALDYDAIMTMAYLATGQDGELSLADLLDLGLFPQLDATILARHPTPATPAPTPDTTGEASLFPTPESNHQPPARTDPPDRTVAAGPDSPHPSDSASPNPKRAKKLAGSPARIMIRVDLDTLLRGVPLEGELCEIVGYGPIPISVIEQLLAHESAFIVGVLTKSKHLLGVYHHGRRYPNTYQKSALDFIYPTCAVTGCSARIGLQSDHRHDYAKTHYTVLDFLDRLCPHHHGLKTRKGWALEEGTGKRALVPPDDPRHPDKDRHSQHTPPVPAT
jgi:hypothetical protein